MQRAKKYGNASNNDEPNKPTAISSKQTVEQKASESAVAVEKNTNNTTPTASAAKTENIKTDTLEKKSVKLVDKPIEAVSGTS